jgi:hypothetical protein
MLTKWVNVLLPYGKSALAEQQETQAELDDEKAKVLNAAIRFSKPSLERLY